MTAADLARLRALADRNLSALITPAQIRALCDAWYRLNVLTPDDRTGTGPNFFRYTGPKDEP